MARNGSCVCGAVRIRVGGSPRDLGACHCSICQKWAGGPFFELECGTDVAFEGADNVATFHSSEWAERGFCKLCGSHLFIRSKQSGEYGIPPGLLESDEGVLFTRQVFFDQKPAYYSFSNDTRNISSEYIHERFPHTRTR